MGPSGSGKTTLLTVLGCLLTPTAGAVRLLDRDPEELNEEQKARFRLRHIGYVFQSFRLIRSLTAMENVRIVLEIDGVGKREATDRSRAALAALGLESKSHLLPDALSGGEKQRVAIARALVHDPPLVLADEPTASLDGEAGLAVVETLRRASRETARTVVIVSHDSRLAERADRVVRLRDGRLDSDTRNS